MEAAYDRSYATNIALGTNVSSYCCSLVSCADMVAFEGVNDNGPQQMALAATVK